MGTPELQTSRALRRAAAQELERLSRTEQQVTARRETLREELEGVERELQALRERTELLEGLAQARDTAGEADSQSEDLGDDAGRVLRGAAIRRTAIQLLLERHGAGHPIHYRDWLSLLITSGYAVTGKDPHATFLSNITRSPVVVRAAEPGTYVVEPNAVGRLRAELAEVQAELRDLSATIARGGVPSERLRQHRADLTAASRRLEMQVAEAEGVLSDHRVAADDRRAA
jgi:chromosome segregation ATPase